MYTKTIYDELKLKKMSFCRKFSSSMKQHQRIDNKETNVEYMRRVKGETEANK